MLWVLVSGPQRVISVGRPQAGPANAWPQWLLPFRIAPEIRARPLLSCDLRVRSVRVLLPLAVSA